MTKLVCSRRHVLNWSAFNLGAIAAAQLLNKDLLRGEEVKLVKPELESMIHDLKPKKAHHPPKAKAMISIFMIGGPSQIDMFDPKPELIKLDGKEFPGQVSYDNAAQASRLVMGPHWRFAPRGNCGMELSDLIPHIASIADEITLIRSMRTGINNHVPSLYSLNTGSGVRGRASLGSWLLHALGSVTENLPAFVALTHPHGMPLMGGENWTNGALPSIYQGTVVRAKEPRILNLEPSEMLRGEPQANQLRLLKSLNQSHLEQHPGELDLQARIASYELAAQMQLAAREAFDISSETAATRKLYGVDEDATRDYGTRCLIARRLVERGVRFVQIFNNGQSWDHHDSIIANLPLRCKEIDQPAAALVTDLKQRGLLDSTIVHWGSEMGRLPVIQVPAEGNVKEKVGRDHNTFGFSSWVAGGGFKAGYVHGATDEFSHHAIEDVVTHHDWLATVLHLFGLDHRKTIFRSGQRDIKLVESETATCQTKLLA